MLRAMKILLLSLVLDLLWAGSTGAQHLVADLNGANIVDFALLAENGGLKTDTLVINEFMASNSSCAQDPQGEYDDWVEIHNYGSDAIDIGGMYLTDNLSVPTKWRIPDGNPAATTIPAGGYLLIWADNDTGDVGLHANFKLNAGGEEIGLFDFDGSTLIDSVAFGEQTTDISCGRDPDASDNWQLFGAPSPAGENISVYQGFVDDVKFSHKHGFYDTPFSVTLATETKDAVIYYTLDGREPYELVGRSRRGTVYTAPIMISETTPLRAIAIKPGWKPSNIEMQAYIFLEPDVRDFSSNLPIAVVDTFGKGVGQSTETQTLTFAGFINTPTHGRAGITDPLDFVGRGGLNIRGKSSRGFAKKQYHFETLDEHNDDKDVSILGFPAESDWILQAPYSDKSLMRNVLAYKWSNDIGRYAVRTQFIELFLNTDGRGVSMSDYVGVYVLMEKIKQGTNRVNITKLEPSDSAEPQITGGYIIKKDKLDPGDQTFYTRTGQHLAYVEPNGPDITQAQKNWIKSYLDEFESVLYGQNFTDPIYGYARYIDVDSFIDHHILVELAKNIDGFRLSTYMFKDRGGKLNMGPVWDYNLSLGNANYLEGWKPDGWYNRQLNSDQYPWWRRLFEDPHFCLRYADRWYGLRKNVFDKDLLLNNIDNFARLLSEAQVRNFARWSILGSYVWPNWFIAQTYQEEIDWMKTWLEGRLTWMDSQIANEFAAAPPLFNQHGGEVNQRFNLTMTTLGRAPIIYYTLDGSDPHLLGTSQQDDDTSTTFIPENAAKLVLVPTGPTSDNWKDGRRFNDSAWLACLGSPGGLGFSRGAGYNSLISLNLADRMYRKNATCYIRIPFTFNDSQDSFDFMTLRIRYDDGFIAYLNGFEVARRNFTGTPAWDSNAGATHSGSAAVNFEDIDISAFLGALQTGNNILAIQGLNFSATSSDFLISAELVAGKSSFPPGDISLNGLQYTGPIPLTHSVHVKARIKKTGTWSALNEATFAVGPVADNLRITEIMYHPQSTGDSDDPNEEYIELKNVGAETINLNLAKFTDGIGFTFPNIELAHNEYVVVVQDRSAFEARYGTGMNIAGEYSGRLNNAGERIRLEDAIGQTILDFDYGDDWRPITDGDGFSLTVIDPISTETISWNEKDSWRASAYLGGSPGTDDSGIIPNPGAVVINEVLTFSRAGAADWIELHNTTEVAIDIGGWFLSDSGSNLTKYEIATGTMIGPYEYVVFYEDLHFGNSSNPGCHTPFALSKNGEEVYLSSSEAGVLMGYRQAEDFGASETGVSFGRYYKPSTGNFNFVPMAHNTPGSDNAYPKVGPIVINEIMYNPSWPEGGSYTNDQYEYIELYNISAEPVTLYRYDKGQPWKFTDGIDFTFPDDAPVTIPAGGYLLVVKNPDAFAWRYPAVPVEKILGPYSGKLNNGGERLQLSMPGDVDEFGTRYYIRVDRVSYSDGFHPEDCPGGIDLWPTAPDGGDESLMRKIPADYGNDPDNWTATAPSPGQ